MSDAAAPTPAARLEASRERLCATWRVAAAARGDAAPAGAPWLDALTSIPGARVLVGALQAWWTQHPLHVGAQVFSGAAQALVRPLAQRHPLALVLGSLVVGGLFAAGKPWRWILTPTLLAGLLPQLVSKAVALVPAQSWMAVVASLAGTTAPSETTPTGPAPTATGSTGTPRPAQPQPAP